TRFLRVLLIPVAALGSMPLTAYSLHVVLLAIVGDDLTHGVVPWAQQVIGLAVFATLWVAIVGSGPLERLVARTARWFAVPTPASPAPQGSPGSSPPAA